MMFVARHLSRTTAAVGTALSREVRLKFVSGRKLSMADGTRRNDVSSKCHKPSAPATSTKSYHHLSSFVESIPGGSSHLRDRNGSTTAWNGLHTTSVQSQKPQLERTKVSDNNKLVTVVQEGGKEISFNATWLRLNCQCEMCVHPVAKQRFIQAADLAPVYTVREANVKGGNSLSVTWHEEDHDGKLPLDFLLRYDYSEAARKTMLEERTPPTSPCKGEITRLPYQTVSASERGLWDWVKCLNEQGICIVKDVPADVSVLEIVGKIAHIHPTVYGPDLFVTKISPGKAINNAYTTEGLTLHMDLPYYESPPGYQFLLCERFDDCIEGGESIMVDAWYEAQRMKDLYPDLFETMTRVPATFHNINYARDRVDMEFRSPHFVVDRESGEITHINWTEGMQGPLSAPEEDVEPYFEAYQKYASMLKHSESKVQFRLKVGELLGFNNRRFVHGRTGFKPNGGARTFPGCYIGIDEMKCRAQLLSNEFNQGKRVKRVFNRSSI